MSAFYMKAFLSLSLTTRGQNEVTVGILAKHHHATYQCPRSNNLCLCSRHCANVSLAYPVIHQSMLVVVSRMWALCIIQSITACVPLFCGRICFRFTLSASTEDNAVFFPWTHFIYALCISIQCDTALCHRDSAFAHRDSPEPENAGSVSDDR